MFTVQRIGVIGMVSCNSPERRDVEERLLRSFYHYQRGCPNRFNKLITDFIEENYSSLFVDDIYEVLGNNLRRPADVVVIMLTPYRDSLTYQEHIRSFLDSLSIPYIDTNDEETIKLLHPIEDLKQYVRQSLEQYYQKVPVVGSLKLRIEPAAIREEK